VEETRADGGVDMVTAPYKSKWFNAQRFARDKPPGVTRVFALGGSTTYGHPYDDAVSFPGWLRELLADADDGRTWEVINCGGISYASYREAVLMEELLAYEPDVFILYSGPNEFLEARTYPGLADTPGALLRLGSALSRTRLFAVARRVFAGDTRPDTPDDPDDGRSRLPAEVTTLLDQEAGLDLYSRDDALRDDILEHFRFNLGRMAEMAADAGAHMVFVTPASELRDCAPFKSEHSPDIDERAAARVAGLLQEAAVLNASGRHDEALARLETAVGIDPRFALTQYRLGETLFALGRTVEARAALERARDEDVCPLRPLGAMRELILDVAREHGASAVDFVRIVDDECERRFGHRVPGAAQFLDHVHLDVAGYRLLGLALLQRLVDDGLLTPRAGWGPAAIDAVGERVEARLDRVAQGFALRNLAKTLGWAGKHAEADRLARQTLELLGDGDAESHFLRGTFAAHAGRMDEAAGHYQRAIAIDSDYAEAHLNLADALIALGRHDEALPHLERTVALDPTRAQAFNVLGLLLMRANRLDQALERFDASLSLRPDDARTLNNRALALIASDRLGEAAADLERAIAIDPGYAKAHYNLAVLREGQGRRDDAVRHLRDALAGDPDHEDAAKRLKAFGEPLPR
jgi:tetratricopeptide (TPR) repeat protein